MAAIWPGPFEQILNLPLPGCCIWNWTEIGPGVSEEKPFEKVDDANADNEGWISVYTICCPGAFGSGELKKKTSGALETIIQNHFKSHMPGLRLISTVSFLKLEIGMNSRICYIFWENVLRIASLDLHHCWDLGTGPLTRWIWQMNVYWRVTSKISWFWYLEAVGTK